MKPPSRQKLIVFIYSAFHALDEWSAQSGEPFEIKNIEEVDSMTVPQLRLLASVIIALGYKPEDTP